MAINQINEAGKEEYFYESIDFSDAPEWMKELIEDSYKDKLAFEAEFVGCEECESVHVVSSTNDAGELVMSVNTPLGHAFITKAQAMAFFGLVEA